MTALTLTSTLLSLLSLSTAIHPDAGPPAGSDPLTWVFYGTPEIIEPVPLPIEGTIPAWLTGSLYRGAAATWDKGNFTAEHWFDGFSRNHRFEIANGGVSYRSRNGSDELADFVEETGLIPGGTFGGDPCKVIFGALESKFRNGVNERGDSNSFNVNVAWVKNFPGLARNTSSAREESPLDTLVMTTEGNAWHQIDPVTLEPIELFSSQAYNVALNESGRMAAHVASSDEGSIYNYVLDLDASPPVYKVFGISAESGESTILAMIDDAPPAYLHAVFSTQNYVVLIVWQADFTQDGKTYLSAMGEWDPERKTLFYVIDRHNGGVVAKYESEEAFFAFHEINSFEDKNGDIIIDLPTMEDYSFIFAAHMDNLRNNLGSKTTNSSAHDLQGRFTRYRLPNMSKEKTRDGAGGLVTLPAELVFQFPKETRMELPYINGKYSRKDYQYAYGVHTAEPGWFVDSLIKFDVKKMETRVWMPKVKHLPSEPVFVAAPDAVNEDDGVLLTVAMDAEVKTSSLVVVNATTMEEMGRARMPSVMGYGFHGVWGESMIGSV